MRKLPFFGYQPPPGGGSSPASTTSAVTGMTSTQKTAVVAALIASIVVALVGVSLVVNNVSSTQQITPSWQIYRTQRLLLIVYMTQKHQTEQLSNLQQIRLQFFLQYLP